MTFLSLTGASVANVVLTGVWGDTSSVKLPLADTEEQV